MPKKVMSTVKEYPGFISISEPLTLPQVIGIKRALRDNNLDNEKLKSGEQLLEEYYSALLPAFLSCLEDVQLEGVPEPLSVDSFPGTPPLASAELAAWLITSVMELFKSDVDPNE